MIQATALKVMGSGLNSMGSEPRVYDIVFRVEGWLFEVEV
jgi:hypothetical protein